MCVSLCGVASTVPSWSDGAVEICAVGVGTGPDVGEGADVDIGTDFGTDVGARWGIDANSSVSEILSEN